MTLTGVAVLSVTACTHNSGSRNASPPAATASAAPSVPALTAVQARSISANLTSGRTDALASALAVPSGQALDPAAAAGLQKLGPITFDLSTFHRTSGTDASIVGSVAHPPAGTGGTWTFTLSYTSGTWLVVDASPTS